MPELQQPNQHNVKPAPALTTTILPARVNVPASAPLFPLSAGD